VITQIASGQRRIKLGALHPTRDFSFVADTVRGFMAIADAPEAVGEVINTGANFEISIGDTVNLIAEIMGHEIEIEAEAERLRPVASEVDRLWADNGKAKRLAGWEPQYAGRDGLRRGLGETIEWFSDPANLAVYKTSTYNI
jgi:dTDP-glucose 4,6-dehydratase